MRFDTAKTEFLQKRDFKNILKVPWELINRKYY
jgi:hypothetical protein